MVSVGLETNRKQNLGNYTGAEIPKILLSEWMRHYGQPDTLQFDPEGCFREDRHFKSWLSEGCIRPNMLPGEASWKLGTINKLIDSVKGMATKLARRVPHDVSAQEIFDAATTAHGDLHRRHGFSPFQLMTGRTPKGIGPQTPEFGTASATLQSGPMQKRLEVQRAAYEVYLSEHDMT